MTPYQRLLLGGTFGVGLILSSARVHGAEWICPDSGNDLHHREVLATSAPEVKVRTTIQDDSAAWVKTLKPLTTKAIRLAKEERSKAIQEGVERSCNAPQTYVAQIVNVADTASGRPNSRSVTPP